MTSPADELPVDFDYGGAAPSARVVPPDQHPWSPAAIGNWENHRTRTPPSRGTITEAELRVAVQEISYTTPHPGLEHVDWADEWDSYTIGYTLLTALGFTVEGPVERPV